MKMNFTSDIEEKFQKLSISQKTNYLKNINRYYKRLIIALLVPLLVFAAFAICSVILALTKQDNSWWTEFCICLMGCTFMLVIIIFCAMVLKSNDDDKIKYWIQIRLKHNKPLEDKNKISANFSNNNIPDTENITSLQTEISQHYKTKTQLLFDKTNVSLKKLIDEKNAKINELNATINEYNKDAENNKHKFAANNYDTLEALQMQLLDYEECIRQYKNEITTKEKSIEDSQRYIEIVKKDNADIEFKSLKNLKGSQFEKYCANLLHELGYSVQVTKGSGDFGADLILNGSISVQCKLYSNPVSFRALQEVYSSMAKYKTKSAWVITNSRFTKQAMEFANDANIKLIDGVYLKSLINQISGENNTIIYNSNKNITDRKAEITELYIKIDDINSKIYETRNRIIEIENLINEIPEIKNIISQLNNNISPIKQEIQDIKNEINEINKDIDLLSQEINYPLIKEICKKYKL
jgi:restriction system protein